MTTYEVGAWFIVEADSEQAARDKVVEGVVGGRGKLGEIADWDVDGIEQVEEMDLADHVDSDRPPGTSGSWGEA